MDWRWPLGNIILVLILFSTNVKSDNDEKKIVCYYTNWSVYRPGSAKYSPQNINPYLCTHLIYAFGGFTKDNTLKPFDKYQDIDKGGYAKFTGLKTYNKNLKTLLAIGGWNEGSSRFSPMVADAQRRRKFVKNVVKFLRQNHFDGLDLDWEYPAFREGGKPRDKDNYADLVQELREEFEKESSKTGKPRLLLTMAVPAGVEYIDKGYDIPRLNEYLDFINLLSYDYHSAYEPAVNHHSPIYPLEEDNEYNYDNELTIDYTIKHLLKAGATSEKIVLGIPTYGRSYTLFNEDATALGSPADGPGEEGDATREKGYLAYYEICENAMKDEWIVEKPNPKAMGPFAHKGNQWVGYDDEDIVRLKSKYVNENKLGGIMFWSIDNDDFRGKCHGRPYPLIEAAKEALLEENVKEKVDERPNAISTRKRNRVSETSNSNSQANNQKSSSNRRTTSRSSTDKRTPAPKSRSRSRSRTAAEHKTEESENEYEERDNNAERTKSTNKSTRPRAITNENRFKTRQNTNDRNNKKQTTARPVTTTKSQKNKITTPEPPTTPDPGSDFKCEDEGFFPHPRDCKKYFWCLDSGPSGLGIVANQFTCPSGLVFNKLADSCDYPRNVVCPKIKPKPPTESTTTQRTTTTTTEKIVEEEDEEDEDEDEEYENVKNVEDKKDEDEQAKKIITTTARSLLYKTINRNRPATTTTTNAPTTILSINSDDISDEEQDPKVIKELIELIKKAGGIEQLEKQLALQEKNAAGDSGSENGKVTPATISKSLYERVLSRQNNKNNLYGIPPSRFSNKKNDEVHNAQNRQDEEIDNNKSTSNIKFVNGPGRLQFDGLDEVPEVKGLRRNNKPKYVTIERHGSSTTPGSDDDILDDEEDDADDDVEGADNEDEASSEKKLISRVSEDKTLSTLRSTPGYFNIRRSRPTTEISRSDTDVKEPVIDESYKSQTIHRTSFRQPDPVHKEVIENTEPPKTRYVSANRFRSTTNIPLEEAEQTNKDALSKSTTAGYDNNLINKSQLLNEKLNEKSETKQIVNENYETTKKEPISTLQPDNEEKVVTKSTTEPQLFSESFATTKATSTSQFYDAGYVTTVVNPTTLQSDNKPRAPEEKTVTVDGESGRISIPSFTTQTPSTTQSTPENLSSTLKSSNLFTKEKFVNHRYITKPISESTVSTNPSIKENSVTESTRRVSPTESNVRETIAAVSQPRPFGYHRRGRPTTVALNNFESTRKSVTEIESTPKTKVSTYSRFNTRSTTTTAPRTRTRSRTRIRDKTVSTVSDESVKLKNDTSLKPSSEVQDITEKDAKLVITPRNPGLNLFRRPGEAPLLPRGVYTTIPSATLPPTTKYYPVQLDIDNTRVIRLTADQNGNPQNLELILADPPASISSTTDYSGKPAFTRPNFRSKISTAEYIRTTTGATPGSVSPSKIISSEKRRQGQKYDSDKVASRNSYEIRSRPFKSTVADYNYYDDEEERFVANPNDKIIITSRGFIKCLDQGNFPHPNSCKKFITCAKMVNDKVIGTEYTCPAKLSFDPIGGICNWSAGLGCNE